LSRTAFANDSWGIKQSNHLALERSGTDPSGSRSSLHMSVDRRGLAGRIQLRVSIVARVRQRCPCTIPDGVANTWPPARSYVMTARNAI
jgi:hypothetical protein